ncbi:MAG: ABC transporter permease [Labedaea sp.]
MTWLTWRQFRIPFAAMLAALAALVAILALTGPGVADDYATGLAACTKDAGDCSGFVTRFFTSYQNTFLALVAVMLILPPLVGLFWGAPLIARELETGTHRLVWNQSITRTRWLAVKLGLVGLAAMTAAALGSLAVTWWSSTIDQAAVQNFPRLGSMVFDARGLVPVGYAAFAFALGVTVGMLMRRALVAMAITLVVFATVQVAMPMLVRPYLLPPTRVTLELSPSIMDGLSRPQGGEGRIRLQTKAPDPGGWLLSSQTLDASGKPVDDVAVSIDSPACAGSGSPQDIFARCVGEINRLGYRQQMTYHAPSRFWPFQWIETGIYLAISCGLAGFCFWWLRRRVI